MKFDQIKHHVAAEVRAAIARAGLTHKQVAEAIGVTEATFSRKTNGITPFSVVEVILIAAVLGIDHESLVKMPEGEVALPLLETRQAAA
jgi:transcriptional regulator with XRE-family HTH domain